MRELIVLIMACVMFTLAIVVVADLADPARPVRLVGLCNNKMYAGWEEDQFPQHCTWIRNISHDPIR